METDLYRDIMTKIISHYKMEVRFENLNMENPNEVVEMACYKTIQNIRTILDNDTLDDFECIERIVKLLEGIGTDGGSRHDF